MAKASKKKNKDMQVVYLQNDGDTSTNYILSEKIAEAYIAQNFDFAQGGIAIHSVENDTIQGQNAKKGKKNIENVFVTLHGVPIPKEIGKLSSCKNAKKEYVCEIRNACPETSLVQLDLIKSDVPQKGKKQTDGFKFIDLFAGIGGIRMAFESANAQCVFSSEWDASAQKTYEANYHEKPFGDITKIKPEDIPNFEILTGGFPCQPFSMIGKREGFNHKTQGTLFFYIAEILRVKKPNAFLLENVPGLLTHDGGKTFNVIMETLDELGYTVKYKVLDSSDFGVPQYRKRLYFVGFLKELESSFEFPKGNAKKVGIGQFVEKDAEGPSISEYLQKTYIFKKEDGHPEVIDENSNFPVKTLCASYHKIQRLTGTFVRGGKTGLRLLTENECKAIMGFPKDFIVPVSRTQMYHQFGNSVAVPVVRAIAKKLVATLEECLTVKKD